MKNIFFYSFIFLNLAIYSQTKVAILDFENTSGISKYDGFGKALSNMLITDLKNSIHPRKVTFLERSQLNKILSEQNLQKSKNFDKSTAVSFGKLAGVKYVLVGSVYVMDGTCNITSRLVDVQTSEIVHAKESNGKIANWLSLKSVLANELSSAMNNPVTIEAVYSEKETSEGVLTQYAKVIDKMDEGDVEGAQEMTEMLSAVQPDFKYFDELKLDIEELKKQVAKNTSDIKILNDEVNENVTDYLELGYKYADEKNFSQAEKYFLIGFNKVSKSEIVDYLNYILALSELYYNYGKYIESLKYSEMGLYVYPYFKEFTYFKYISLAKLNRLAEFDQIVKTAEDIRKYSSDSLIVACLKTFSEKNNVNYYTIEKYLYNAIKFKNYVPFYSEYGGEFYFNQNFANPFNTIALGCIQDVYNGKPEHAAALLKQLDLSNSSSEVKFSVAWYTMLSADFTSAKKQWDDIVLNDFSRISDCANYGETMMVKAGILKSSVLNVRWVYDKKNQIVYQDSIREYHPSGTIRSFDIPEEQRDTIKLKKPFWYYEYNDGRGFVTLNPIEAYIFKVNLQFPVDEIIDCIKSSGCINWSSVSESKKMALINWGHSYLLSGETIKAIKIYQLFPSDFRFSEDFQHMTYEQVLKSDWSEFQEKGLIDKSTKEKVISELSIK